MSDFVFTMQVKPPQQSTIFPSMQMVEVTSNVRIPDWVLNKLGSIHESPFYGWLPSKAFIGVVRLQHNHVVVLHLRQELWRLAGDKILEILAFAPSNSRKNFPARILHEDAVTGKIVKVVEYPIL